MKVLYISSGQDEDYQRDTLFHGLRELLGRDAVDAPRIASLYSQPDQAKHAMYGRGYTVYANLPDIAVDRGDILARITRREFDLVIYGSVHRCREHLGAVLRAYPPQQVLFVDGEDAASLKWHLLGRGLYLKRELEHAQAPFIQPIYFAVPAEKFVAQREFEDNLLRKQLLFAPCDPRDRGTYRFLAEPDYYQQYRDAWFGVTMKKAGWDCMRHHEIVAQGTAPYFIGLEQCPAPTMHLLPRPLLHELRSLADAPQPLATAETRGVYSKLMRQLFTHYQRHFTTAALARYVLNSVSDSPIGRGHAWALQARHLRDRGRAWATELLATRRGGLDEQL